jgi:hypothetical protein
MRYHELMTEGIYDETEQPHGSFGWWIFPDGRVEEMEEAGNHGMIADQWLTSDMSIPEVPYEEAIEILVKKGGVRVATFHGSDAMGIDFPPTLLPVVRNALLKLVRETRDDFNTYFIGYQTVQAFDYRGIVKVIRDRP